MKRRQAGFSFIEIMVVMAIISVLVSMVVFVVPTVLEKTKQAKSKDNVRGMLQYYISDGVGLKPWPKYSGKRLILWLVAANKIDRRDEKQLAILFSPGDTNYMYGTEGGATQKDFATLTTDMLKTDNPDFKKLTSYAARRNADRGHELDSDELSRNPIVICDDDDGPVHHKAGMVVGYTGGGVDFMEWDALKVPPPADPKNPEGLLGDNSPSDELKHLSSD